MLQLQFRASKKLLSQRKVLLNSEWPSDFVYGKYTEAVHNINQVFNITLFIIKITVTRNEHTDSW